MLVILLSPIPKLQHAPLPSKVLWGKERALTPYSFDVFNLDSHLSPLRSLGERHKSFEKDERGKKGSPLLTTKEL
jgi:hypothetical protein